MRALRRRYGRAVSGPVDETAANELDLYAENESSLYNQKRSILAIKEFGSGTIDTIFNKATRMHLAKELADRYRSGEE